MAKYIVTYSLKVKNNENSDLEKILHKISSSCEKIAPTTFVIDSLKTARRIIESLSPVLKIKGNFREEFYTALPAALYDTISEDSVNYDTAKIFIGELRGKATWYCK